MILSDPWDLKHQIEQLQQQELHSKNLLSKHQKSSTNFRDEVVTDTNYASNIEYLSESQHHQEEITSDQNSMNQPNNIKKSTQSSYFEPSQTCDSQFVEAPKRKSRNKYGNLIVFFQTSRTFFSIGPNYIFFTFAYICFTLASIYLVQLVNHSLENYSFKIFNLCFCILQNISYLLVAFSNPGVQLPESDVQMSSQIKDNRMCKKCGALQQRKTYHCRQCDICVKDYDHHCPWTSKCIGGGNLKRFYLFVGITPFYIFYYVIAFMICMANIAVGQNTHLKNQSQPPKL